MLELISYVYPQNKCMTHLPKQLTILCACVPFLSPPPYIRATERHFLAFQFLIYIPPFLCICHFYFVLCVQVDPAKKERKKMT